MKVAVKNQPGDLSNTDIKWYLSDEKLWVTKYSSYADIEGLVCKTAGSFNWLCEVNDTMLFDKATGIFQTAIIGLSGKIKVYNCEKPFFMKDGQKGSLYLEEKGYFDFEFPEVVTYDKKDDSLISLPKDIDQHKIIVLYIVEDFGFIIMENQLIGWILKRASKHVYVTQTYGNVPDNIPELLAEYIDALNLWEENDDNTYRLEKLLENIRANKDSLSLAIQESIQNIISWHMD